MTGILLGVSSGCEERSWVDIKGEGESKRAVALLHS